MLRYAHLFLGYDVLEIFASKMIVFFKIPVLKVTASNNFFLVADRGAVGGEGCPVGCCRHFGQYESFSLGHRIMFTKK